MQHYIVATHTELRVSHGFDEPGPVYLERYLREEGQAADGADWTIPAGGPRSFSPGDSRP